MGETLGKRTPWGRSGGTDTAMVALGVESVGPCRCRESEPPRGVAGTGRCRSTHGPVEALEEVAVGGAVEVLGHPHRGVPQEPGHVLDAGAGLGQRLMANTWRRTGSPLLTTALGRRRPPSGRQALREQKGASASRRPRAPLQPPAAERYGVAAAHWFAGSRAAGLSLKSGGPRDFALELCGGPRRPVDLVASGGGRRGGEAERRFGAVDLWRLRRVGASIGARPCEAHVVTGLEGAARRSM
jgi:hypothetical protein